MRGCRILLANDDPPSMGTLDQLLTTLPGVEVVDRVRDGLQVMALAFLHRPDVVVVKQAMPGLGGLELTRRLVAEPWAPRVVLTSREDEPESRHAAETAGASGFVLEQEFGTKLVPIVRSLTERRTDRSPIGAGSRVGTRLSPKTD